MIGSRRAVVLAAAASLCGVQAAIAQPPGSTTPAPTLTYGQQPKPGQQGGTRIVPQGFSVVLVLADLSASGAQDDVPPAARRALNDMKDFLPYKSYRLLDAAWILGQGAVQTTRLRGPDEQEYELRLAAYPNTSASQPGRVSVQFSLRDGGTAEEALVAAVRGREATAAQRRSEETQIRQEIARLENELRAVRSRKEAKEEDRTRTIERQLENARARLNRVRELATPVERETSSRKATSARSIIDTSFMMEVGETVVVGTSRLRGNSRALIALLTAVPPKGRTPDLTR